MPSENTQLNLSNLKLDIKDVKLIVFGVIPLVVAGSSLMNKVDENNKMLNETRLEIKESIKKINSQEVEIKVLTQRVDQLERR